MDYNQEQFFRAQFDVPKMPFYMSYPMQNLYLTEMEYEKDMDRMKELYPKEVGRIVECVEDECDRMEYEGSLMFDEYPDRLMIGRPHPEESHRRRRRTGGRAVSRRHAAAARTQTAATAAARTE